MGAPAEFFLAVFGEENFSVFGLLQKLQRRGGEGFKKRKSGEGGIGTVGTRETGGEHSGSIHIFQSQFAESAGTDQEELFGGLALTVKGEGIHIEAGTRDNLVSAFAGAQGHGAVGSGGDDLGWKIFPVFQR